MYVSLNREAMQFVHAHPSDQSIVSNLAHIELSHVHVCIFDASDERSWGRFTDLELKLLYRNTCGQELPGYMKSDHIRRVAALASALPVVDANAFEVRLQAGRIGMEDKRRYRYVKGQGTPALQEDLFEPSTLRVGSVPDVPATPASAPTAGAQGPDRTPAAPTLQARTASAPSAPPSKGTGAAVFAVADAMWEAAGKPTDARTVLVLRKSIMDKLESEQGIKRTTASTTLGAWQKLRLNG